jgi:hypothetical protein
VWDYGISAGPGSHYVEAAMGEQQEAGQAAFLNRKRLTWMEKLVVVKINLSQALRDRR